MKCIPLIALLCMLSNLCIGQDESKIPNFLWEISGNDLPGTSYLFGSAHLNDSRVLQFDDSLYYALKSCEQFAAEIDMSRFDSSATQEILDFVLQGILDEDTRDSMANAREEKGSDNVFEEMDMKGKSTFMDAFLYRAAMNLGLSSYGLEEMEDQLQILSSSSYSSDEFLHGSSDYEKLIGIYRNRDWEELKRNFSFWFDSGFEIKKRNSIQADSFERLAKKGKTFGVVGLFHLFGEDNVLEILEKQGYSVRQVYLGNPTSAIDSLYQIPRERHWHSIEVSELGVSLLSNIKIDPVESEGIGYFLGSVEIEQGLIYFSMLLKAPEGFEETFIGSAKADIFPDTLALSITPFKKGNRIWGYNFENLSEKNAYKARFSRVGAISVFQMVVGISHSAIESSSADAFLNGMEILPVKQKMTPYYSSLGAFHYRFPDSIPFTESLYTHNSFPEHGKAQVAYKAYKNPISEEEYLVRYNTFPPGVYNADPYLSLQGIVTQFSNLYAAEPSQVNFFTKQGLLALDAKLTDSTNADYYVRSLIKGSSTYVLLQKSPSQRRDSAFFEGLRLTELKFDPDTSFTYPDAGFSMAGSRHIYDYPTKEEGNPVDNYSINMNNAGVVIDLKFRKYGPYDEVALDDSLFTQENLVDLDKLDSLVSFTFLKVEDVCPGYLVSYTNDSTYNLYTVGEFRCNQHQVGMEIIAPLGLESLEYMGQLIETIHFEVNDSSRSSLTDRKAERLFRDLASSDSSIFNQAAAAYDTYTDIRGEDLPDLYKLLNTDLWGDREEIGVKYGIISDLHNFETPEVEHFLQEYYTQDIADELRYRILESFSRRDSDSAAYILLSLLEKTPAEASLPESLYEVFQDSTELFAQNYLRMKNLARSGVGEQAFLAEVVRLMERDSVPLFVKQDSVAIQLLMEAQIQRYLSRPPVDSTLSMEAYIMDYLLLEDLGETEKGLYEFILETDDIYGKYRSAYNKLAQGEELTDPLLSDVMDNDYYRYWMLVGYDSFDKEVPSRYRDKEETATVIMKNYIYDNYDYWCDSCFVVREVYDEFISPKSMLFMKCKTDQEGAFYWGIIGPFEESGRIYFDEEKSVYYNTPYQTENPEELLESFLGHLKGT